MKHLFREPIYFGCGPHGIGHFLYSPNGSRYRGGCSGWTAFDALLPPGGIGEREGVAALHHFSICTVLAFWDRSADKRGGSHSTFFLPGMLSFADAVIAARKAFPWVFARMRFEVTQFSAAAGRTGK